MTSNPSPATIGVGSERESDADDVAPEFASFASSATVP
jgi:hypothetical protein